MKKYLVTFFILITIGLTAADDLLEIVPSVQGVWYCFGYSQDKGQTITNVNGLAFCRVSSTSILMADGVTHRVSRVQLDNEKGIDYLIIHFINLDSYWVISDRGNNTIMVQIINIAQQKETTRFLFRVTQ